MGYQANSAKLFQLFALLPRRPREFYYRVAAMVDSRVESYRHHAPRHDALPWDILTQQLSKLLATDVDAVLREEELSLVEKEVARGIGALPAQAPFPLFHNGDLALARLCYMLVRVTRPSTVVETGVCYGVTSAFLLQALRVNGAGCLHSIDLPPLAKTGDEFVGRLVPEDLRPGWRLHRGRSVELLPNLVRELRQIDLFLHDSLHTYRNMRQEFEIVTPFLAPQAILVADDVQGNSAFIDWVSRSRTTYFAALQEHSKPSLLGLAMLAGQRPKFGQGEADGQTVNDAGRIVTTARLSR
jgi:predicted O-methyltransferase YrrM